MAEPTDAEVEVVIGAARDVLWQTTLTPFADRVEVPRSVILHLCAAIAAYDRARGRPNG